jgi:hypothetical protein
MHSIHIVTNLTAYSLRLYFTSISLHTCRRSNCHLRINRYSCGLCLKGIKEFLGVVFCGAPLATGDTLLSAGVLLETAGE